MITIVIADDEKLIRAGIRKILTKELDVPVSITEARNGEEALEICRKSPPDLVITDIRMPSMNGIELMQALQEFEKKPIVIVLSGYDEFAYAKQAMSVGAMSYILKPVDKDELRNTVVQAIDKAYSTERSRNELVLKRLVESGHLDDTIVAHGNHFENDMCCVAVCGGKCNAEVSSVLQNVRYYVLEEKKNFTLFVVPGDAVEILRNAKFNQVRAIGVSTMSTNLTSLRVLRIQAYSALLQMFFYGEVAAGKGHGVFTFDEDMGVSSFSNEDALYERCVDMLDISSSGEIVAMVSTLFDFSSVPQNRRGSILFHLYNKIIMNLFQRFPSYSDSDVYLSLKGIMIENIWEASSLSEWQNYVQDYMLYLSTLLQQNSPDFPFINEAIGYIKKNFSKNINMAIVANHVSVNYTYFSETFKKHTGMAFNDYLKRIRIEEACRLLSKGCYKVYEVAQRSGFGDVKYFMKTFKSITGVTPGEYRKIRNKSV